MTFSSQRMSAFVSVVTFFVLMANASVPIPPFLPAALTTMSHFEIEADLLIRHELARIHITSAVCPNLSSILNSVECPGC